MKNKTKYNSRKKQVFKYCEKYILKNGFSPTYREIAAAVGISLSFVHKIIHDLEKDGDIITSPYKAGFFLSSLCIIKKDKH